MTVSEHTPQELPIACDLNAIPAAERDTHGARAQRLLCQDAAEVRELPDGYALRYSADVYEEVTRFIGTERRCCPFFTFALEVSPQQGPIWLRITGPAEAKTILQTALGHGS